MKNSVQELLRLIVDHADRFLKFIKECGKFLNELVQHIRGIVLEIPKSAKATEFLLAFAFVIGAAFLLILICASIHLLLARVFKRQAEIFISYHHERELIAQEISDSMTLAGIKVVRLPFVERPDHDELLERIRNEIHNCDVLVCVPGDQTSFVDSEVSMAFALGKPLIVVVFSNDVPRVPNTAKKGCPIFLIEELKQRSYRPLVGLCSYLSGDLRSTLNIYKSALNHIAAFGTAIAAAFLVQLAIFSFFIDPDFIEKMKDVDAENWRVFTDPAMLLLLSPPMALILLPYLILVAMRFEFRFRFSRVMSGMRFAEVSISESLGYAFFKEDLSNCLFRGKVHAHHESPIDTDIDSVNPADRYNEKITLEASRAAEERARAIHSGKCSRCGKNGPIDVWHSYFVLSYLINCETSEIESICCRKCAVCMQVIGIGFCLAAGWWSVQGLFYTPLYIFRNVLAFINSPHPAYPSARLIQIQTPEIRLRRRRRNTSGYCPRCSIKVSKDALDCPNCKWQL